MPHLTESASLANDWTAMHWSTDALIQEKETLNYWHSSYNVQSEQCLSTTFAIGFYKALNVVQ